MLRRSSARWATAARCVSSSSRSTCASRHSAEACRQARRSPTDSRAASWTARSLERSRLHGADRSRPRAPDRRGEGARGPGRRSLPHRCDRLAGAAWRARCGRSAGGRGRGRAGARLVYEHGVPIVPRGGGTGLAGGAVPVAGGVVLALSRLSHVEELTPGGWRMRVQAGVTTATVRRLAAENGLFFPPDPGAAEQSQIGGNAATNAGGPHAFKYGGTGSWITGLRAVVGTRKGRDAGRHHAQGHGPVRPTQSFRRLRGDARDHHRALAATVPAPEVVLPIVAFYDSHEFAMAAIEAVKASGVVPAALDFLDGETLRIGRGRIPRTGSARRDVRARLRGRRAAHRGKARACRDCRGARRASARGAGAEAGRPVAMARRRQRGRLDCTRRKGERGHRRAGRAPRTGGLADPRARGGLRPAHVHMGACGGWETSTPAS